MIVVVQPPRYATVQDLGRSGHRAVGIPPSGVADRETVLSLNLALGNSPESAVIECAIGGGVFRATVATTIAIGGAESMISLDGDPIAPWRVIRMRRGAFLRVGPIVHGRFLYIAVRGGIDVPPVLGSRSTLLAAGFGGYEGRRLQSGDVLPVGAAAAGTVGNAARQPLRDESVPIPVQRGPQHALFDQAAWQVLASGELRISHESDRTGVRLDGAHIHASAPDDAPSEPTCVGAIQIPGGGSPIVLMHDGPTVGGYPKIAVVREHALGMLAQRAPGSSVRFVLDE